MSTWYRLLHLILPSLAFWAALTLVLSVFFRRSPRRWQLSMICSAVIISILVGVEAAVLGLTNMP